MKKSINIWVAILFFVVFIANHAYGSETESIRDAINHLMKEAPARRLARDREAQAILASEITEAASDYRIDPFVLTVLAYGESSFRTDRIGKAKNEIGIVQVHGLAAKTCKHDLKTRLGQLKCGARWFRKGFDKCRSLEGAFTIYASGSCKARTKRTAWLVKRRIKMVNKLKGLQK